MGVRELNTVATIVKFYDFLIETEDSCWIELDFIQNLTNKIFNIKSYWLIL